MIEAKHCLGASSRVLSARLLSLSGADRSLDRLVVTSDFLAITEAARDPFENLAARAWRIVPLLERREVPAVDTELEAVSTLAAESGGKDWVRGIELLQSFRPRFLGGRGACPALGSAERVVEALDDCFRAPGDPAVLTLLSEVCSALGDPRVARKLYTRAVFRLADGLDRMSADAWSLARALASLAASAGRAEDAERHMAEASRHAESLDPALLALTRHGGAVLLARFDPERAGRWLGEALRAYRLLGMHGDLERASELLRQLGCPPSERARVRARMVQEGDYWTLEYQGASIHVRDSKGLRDLAQLLRQPGQPVAAVELMAAGEWDPEARREACSKALGVSDENLDAWNPMESDVPDARALRCYAERLRELREEVEQAELASDLGVRERLQGEIDALESELGRRLRPAPDRRGPFERARKAVTKRIRGEIRVIGSHHAPLGRHLDEALRTGGYCTYSPHESVDWSIHAGPGRSALPAK